MDQIEGPWSPEEDEMLLNHFNNPNPDTPFRESVPGRSGKSCFRRLMSLYLSSTPKEDTTNEDITIAEEDEMLQNLVEKHGRSWSLISKSLPGKSADECRSKWLLLQSPFTPEEDEMLQNLVNKHGPDWCESIPGRSYGICELRWESLSMMNEDITIVSLMNVTNGGSLDE